MVTVKRAEEIIQRMHELIAESTALAQKHEQLTRDYEKLKRELDKLRRDGPAKPPATVFCEQIIRLQESRTGYLTSWKEIANYLHCGVRTVQRYESELGLPVHRLTGKLRGTVRATTKEIDAWMNTFPALDRSKVRAREVHTNEWVSLKQGLPDQIFAG